MNSRHRQFAVLASVAAALAMAALLFGAALAGLTATNSGLIIVMISAMFLAASLTTGWVPAVYLSVLMIGLGSIFVGDQLELSRTIVLAATIATVHETARFSLDSRKPTRLGAGLLLRTSLGCASAVGVLAVLAPMVSWITTTNASIAWIPLAITVIGIPFAANRVVEFASPRIALSTTVSLVLACLLSIAIVSIVAAAAQSREGVTGEIRPNVTPTAGNGVADRTTPAGLSTEALSGGIGLAIGGFVVAGFAAILYGAFHRKEILLEQDDVELDLEDERFSRIKQSGDESAGLDREATSVLLGDLLTDLDVERDPGRAVRYGYARVEQHLTTLGIDRVHSETAHEFMSRALPVLGDGESLINLTALFERARFSDEPISEEARNKAREALGDLKKRIDAAPRAHLVGEPLPSAASSVDEGS